MPEYRVLVLSLVAVALAIGAQHAPGAPRTIGASDRAAPAGLAVWDGSRWREFWSAPDAPHRWPAQHPVVAGSVAWRRVAPGVELGDLRLSGAGSAWRLRVALVRMDPRRLDFELQSATREAGLLGAWTVDSLRPTAQVAFNAGQFQGGTPWGWHVEHGRELQPPGTGPLAMAVMFDTAGSAHLLQGEEIVRARARGGAVVAFQSYPAVLMGDGDVPQQLLGRGRGVDIAHRDARLALGIQRDGRLLLALTRFDALGETAAQVPFGPTTPEMAALMGALGCRRAVLLDGGLSAQLAVRTNAGTLHRWPGLRRVPLGIIATGRTATD